MPMISPLAGADVARPEAARPFWLAGEDYASADDLEPIRHQHRHCFSAHDARLQATVNDRSVTAGEDAGWPR